MHTNVLRRFPSMRVLSTAVGLLLVSCGGGDDPVAVVTVSVTPTTATVEIAKSSQLAASALDANGGVISGRKVTWATSNASIATVSTGGSVTGVAAGTALISATIDGIVGNASISVAPPPVATIAISPTSASVVESDTLRLKAVLTIGGGTVVTGRDVTWTSASPAIATVSTTGLVTGVTPGLSVISATSEGKSATTIVTVTQSPCNIGLAVPITSGVPIIGALARTDCDFGDGTYLDLYSFTLATQATLDVRLKSSAFDAYLFIYKLNATDVEKVGENDDESGVPGTDARLSGSLSAGNYVIVANGFKVAADSTLSAAFGPYTLSFTSPYTAPLNAQRTMSLMPNSMLRKRVDTEQARTILRGMRRQR